MNTDEIKNNLIKVISLRDEIKDFKKGSRQTAYKLSDYVDLCYDRIIAVDYGDRDRLYVPYSNASMKLQDFMQTDDKIINSQFSAHKTKLLSILNRYIKDLQLGLQEHDSELNSIHSR